MRFLFFLVLLTAAALAGETPEPLRLYSFQRSGADAGRALQRAVEWMPLGQRKAAVAASSCHSAYDARAVTFFLEMEATGGKGDSVEIWLRPPGSAGYRQYIVAHGSGLLAAFRRTASGGEKRPLNGESVAVEPTAEGWSARVRIPFAALGAAAPKEGERWGFNLCRHRRGEAEELSSWAAIGAFDQTRRFGELVFSTRGDIDADLAFWNGKPEDPHLRRSRVSGLAVARQEPEEPESYWMYDPFATASTALGRWELQGLTSAAYASARGLEESAQERYPGLYATADALNRAVLRLSDTRLLLDELHRIASYRSGAGAEALAREEKGYAALEATLDRLYLGYRARFPSREPEKWGSLRQEVAAFAAAVEEAQTQAVALRSAWQETARAEGAWPKPPASFTEEDTRRNADGAPTRFWFTAYGLFGNEPVADYLGPFRSYHVDGFFLMADRTAQGEWQLPSLPLVQRRFSAPGQRLNFQTSVGQVSYQGPTSAWLEARIAKDPELLAVTQDRLPMPKQKVGKLDLFMRRGINIAHPEVRAYYADYLHAVTRPLKERLDFLLTGWEDRTEIRHWRDGKIITTLRGYDSHSKAAFREALRQRYGSIAALNRRWGGTGYADFSEIEPPPDPWLSGPGRADGLHYEWARWQSASHMEWTAWLRRAIRRQAPGLPVMTDSSHLLLNGTAWEALEAQTCDILSFHYNPANEDAMFAYLQSVARRKGVPLACFEHYEMMYSRLEGDDERLGARTLRLHFSDLAARDVRLQASWLRYMGHTTAYIAAYGGAHFRVDTGQTLLRWPTAELRRYRRQLETTERPLVESAPERGRIALFLPDSTFLQSANLQDPAKVEAPMARFVRFQNAVLTPASLPAEYVHEAMVEADPQELERYTAIVVLDAAFTPAKTLAALKAWAARPGRTLLVQGPLGFFDECGLPLAPEASPLRVAFPEVAVEPERPWQLKGAGTDPETPWLRQTRYGEGALVRMTRPLNAFVDEPGQLASLVRLLEEAAPQSLRVKGGEIRHQLRITPEGRRYLLLSNRDVRKAQPYEVTLPGGVERVVDVGVPGGFPLPVRNRNEGPGRVIGSLQPGDWTLLDLGTTPQ